MTWSKMAMICLIEAYKDHPCLYSIRHLNYRNKMARRKAFETIYTKLQNILPNISFQELKMKVNSLRSTFLLEHRKFSALVENGAESYSPSLWYYDRLLFLADAIPNCQGLKTADAGRILNNSRHRPNILRERKSTNNKQVELVPVADPETEELQTIKDEMLEAEKLMDIITNSTNSCTSEESKVEDLKLTDSEVDMHCDDSQDNDSLHPNPDEVEKNNSISVNSAPAELTLNSIMEQPVKSFSTDKNQENPEYNQQIQAFCNFIGSSLYMIKSPKTQMSVQRQITRLLYDALEEN